MSQSKNITSSIYWWLNSKRPFYVNDDYKIELLFIDNNNHSVKILVTNLKTQSISEQTVELQDEQD